MKQQVLTDTGQFFVSMMEQLNANDDLYHPIPDIIRDTCTFFDYGCGFIYQSCHPAVFYLREHFALYPGAGLPDPMDLEQELGKPAMEALCGQRVLQHGPDCEPSDTACRLARMFGAKALVLVPVCDEDHRLIALVGMADRRARSRLVERNFDFAYAILNAVANHVKLQLFQERVANSRSALETIIDNMGVDVFISDFYTHEILFANRSLAQSYRDEHLVGRPCWQALKQGEQGQCEYCPQPLLVDELGHPTSCYHWEFQRIQDQNWFHAISSAFRWIDGRLVHVFSGVDITENKRNEEVIRSLAERDQLTGLYNRHKLLSDMEESLEIMRPAGEEGYVIFLDLDGFKAINDERGHRAGDELLRQLGAALKREPLMRNAAYRNGGDEFVVLVRGGLARALQVLATLQGLFQRNWVLPGGPARLGASIGVSAFPMDAGGADTLLQTADAAMYACKQQGRGKPLFYDDGRMTTVEAYAARQMTPPG